MDHGDHVRLIREGALGGGKVWADLGSGEGAFTLALADLLGRRAASTRSIGTSTRSRSRCEHSMTHSRTSTSRRSSPTSRCRSDCRHWMGSVMANSLYFQRGQLAVLRLVRGYLRPAGRLVLVEDDTDHGNRWVPFPLSFHSWATVAAGPGCRPRDRLGVDPEPVPRVDLLGAQHPVSGPRGPAFGANAWGLTAARRERWPCPP